MVNISFLIDVIVKFIENETTSGVYNVVSENSSLIDIAHRVAHEEGMRSAMSESIFRKDGTA